MRRGRGLATLVTVAAVLVTVATFVSGGAFGAQGGGTCVIAPVLRDSGVNQGVSGATAGFTPLVRGKDTLVRLYLSGPSCTTQTFQLMSATLQLKNAANPLGSPIAANPAPVNVNGNFPAIATYASAAVSNDSPGDPKFLVPGYQLVPCAASPCSDTGSWTAGFVASVGWRASGGTTGTATFTLPTAAVDKKTNALRILVVKMGDPNGTAGYAAGSHPEFGIDAQRIVQNALGGTLSRVFPVPSAAAAGAAPAGDLNGGTGGIRYSFNIDGSCGSTSPTCGMLDLTRLFLADGTTRLLSPGTNFCLNGTTFGLIQPQLTNMLIAWNAANPTATADRVLGVVDGSVSDQTCALGMAAFNSPQAAVRIDPGQTNNGARVVMELAHTLAEVPAARSPIANRYHSPNTESDAATNRAYNIASQSYIATDRTSMRVVDSSWTDDSTDLEKVDYGFLRCMLGGSTTSDCTTSGTTGTGASVAAEFAVSGSVQPTGAEAKVIESYVASGFPSGPAGTENNYFVIERGSGGGVVAKRDLPVSCDSFAHADTGGGLDEAHCFFSASVPWDANAQTAEIWRGDPNGAACNVGTTVGGATCLYARSKTGAPTNTTVTTSGGGTSTDATLAWIHDEVNTHQALGGSPFSLTSVTPPDGEGNIYAGGYVTDCYPVGVEGQACSKDALVFKLDGNGSWLWSNRGSAIDGGPIAGDPADDIVTGIALAPGGGVFVTGTRSGCAYTEATPRCPVGRGAVFVRKYEADISTEPNVAWSKIIDTPGDDQARGIAYGATNNAVYVAGAVGPYNEPHAGTLWKLPADTGDSFESRTSSTACCWTGVAVGNQDSGQVIYLVGYNQDVVVSMYRDPSNDLGAEPAWTTTYGSDSIENAFGIALGSSGLYVTGGTRGSIVSDATGGVFVSRVAEDGEGVLWTRQFGGANDNGNAIAAGATGPYVVGSTSTVIPGGVALGSQDAYLVHFNPDGDVQYGKLFGSGGSDQGNGVSFDPETGDIIAVGDNGAQIGDDFFTIDGTQDGFAARFSETTSEGTSNLEVTTTWPTAQAAQNAQLDVYYACGGINYPVQLALDGVASTNDVTFQVASPVSGCTNGTLKLFENTGVDRFDVTPTNPDVISQPNTPPVASISQVPEGSHRLQYDSIHAVGFGKDGTDGELSGGSLKWRLTGPSFPTGQDVGQGNDILLPRGVTGLTPGAYTLELIATDAAGLTNTATRHFVVDPDANNDGIAANTCMSDTLFGVAFGDADGDGIPNIDDLRPCVPDPRPDMTPPTLTVDHVTAVQGNNSNGTITFTVHATDAGSGLRSVDCTVDGNPAVGLSQPVWASHTFTDTFIETAAGAHAVICTATDLAFNQTTATDRVYEFAGFLSPINNPPTVNTGKAGRTYPVKWKLIAPNGQSIGDPGLVKSLKFKVVTCGGFANDPADAIEVAATGGTSLRFEGSQWIYNWATPSAKACYELFLLLDDGSTRQANFDLTK